MAGSVSRSRTRSILFDVEGTLVNTRDFNRLEEHARLVGIEVDGEALAHAFREVESERDRSDQGSADAMFWMEVLRRAEAVVPSSDRVEQFSRVVLSTPSVGEVFTDVIPSLEELSSKGFRMGALDRDRDEPSSRGVLSAVKLLAFFEHVTAISNPGVGSGADHLWRRAMELGCTTPRETFYVGGLRRLIRSARKDGVQAVWLNRDGTGFGEDPPEITSMRELVGWIETARPIPGRSR